MIHNILLETVKDYCGVTGNESDEILRTLMNAASVYISSYTGIKSEEFNKHSDFDVAYLVLVNDMYNNRSYSSENNRTNTKINPIVKQILDMHSENLI